MLYGGTDLQFSFDDRALMHLQIVITAKLRRGEGFNFSWADSPESGGGRNSLWLHPTNTLTYRFDDGHLPAINREWIESLILSANSAGGLVYLPEDAPPAGG